VVCSQSVLVTTSGSSIFLLIPHKAWAIFWLFLQKNSPLHLLEFMIILLALLSLPNVLVGQMRRTQSQQKAFAIYHTHYKQLFSHGLICLWVRKGLNFVLSFTPVLWNFSAWITYSTNLLNKESANFSTKWPDAKCFRLHRPYGFCCSNLILVL
jgi:hypothetical protein